MDKRFDYQRADSTRIEFWQRGDLFVVVSTSSYSDGSTLSVGTASPSGAVRVGEIDPETFENFCRIQPAEARASRR